MSDEYVEMAFPWVNPSNGNGGSGMTLRDYFAGQALAALIQKHEAASEHGNFAPQHINAPGFRAALTGGAYAYADAMLAERRKDQ